MPQKSEQRGSTDNCNLKFKIIINWPNINQKNRSHCKQMLTNNTLVWLIPQHHEKNCEERKKIVKKLRQTIRGKEKNNATLDKDLEEMNVSVAERKHINEVNGKLR